jgi:hypothetical protein
MESFQLWHIMTLILVRMHEAELPLPKNDEMWHQALSEMVGQRKLFKLEVRGCATTSGPTFLLLRDLLGSMRGSGHLIYLNSTFNDEYHVYSLMRARLSRAHALGVHSALLTQALEVMRLELERAGQLPAN